MIRRLIVYFLLFIVILSSSHIKAQDFYQAERNGWLKKAEQLKCKLTETVKYSKQLVSLVKDTTAFQGWKVIPFEKVDTLHQSSFKKTSVIVADFGEHITGYFSFSIKTVTGSFDAPVRLKFTFAEVPAELATPFDPYPGTLSRAWLQDETVTVIELPSTITVPRRVAFRYVKIELLGSCSFCDFSIFDLQCKATTSASTIPQPLTINTLPTIKKIDDVGLATLKECMQTVYEDGPKRDRRLWVGDLYLESLANEYSYKNNELTKRCLYLLAALSRKDGYLNSNVFETPKPHAEGGPFLFDYSLLYNVALKEYFVATNDTSTVLDLWPVAEKQLENPKKYLTKDGMFDYQAAQKAGWWLFLDWKEGLDKQASLQGIIIYSMRQTFELAKLLHKENEVKDLPAIINIMTNAAQKNLFNKQSGVFISGTQKQVSYASQAWMILSGVATKDEAQKALSALPSMKNVVYSGTPYLYHYYVEAMIKCGMYKEAKQAVINYWGGMLKKGADTFWEVYDPKNDFLSPYNFYPLNSYCHAWSCTPVYFIRKYPQIFQNNKQN